MDCALALPAPRSTLLESLREFQWEILIPALTESIRLLRSGRFHELTGDHIDAVANYQSIELGDEAFFERAFTPGKEAAASLAFAQLLGRETVLDDLERLHDALGSEVPSLQ